MDKYLMITQPNCVWCDRAKALLTEKGLTFTTQNLFTPEDKAAFKASGFTTVPQIWQGHRYVGGYSELAKELS